MVMRLDAPDPQTVRKLIQTGLRVERNGLRGQVVIDSRGLPRLKDGKPDGYGTYDQTLRDLAELLGSKTDLQVVLDQKPQVVPENAAQDVALYCGWYSLQKYVAACSFSEGAIGFHVASFELKTLHQQMGSGWVRGLMQDGVVGTVGPVAEPYLVAFPKADEFFALLLTGRLTLAEVYWRTNPMTSWMMCMIGDPLYRPYKARPALSVNDLPETLRAIADHGQAASTMPGPAATQGSSGFSGTP
jgi:uncharacterized protein (TIGR03790 family)